MSEHYCSPQGNSKFARKIYISVNNLFGPSMAKAQVGGFGESFGQGGPFGSGQSRTILDTVANTFR